MASENKIVILEGFEPTLTKELIWSHFKKVGIKFITLNPTKGNAYLEFGSEKEALEAIDNNFGKNILKKPVLMALKSDKAGELTQFHLSGLDETTYDLNQIYKVCAKFGNSCKFRFNLRTGGTKPASGGYLSYVAITPAQIENLKKQLELGGVKTEVYNKEKTKKVSVKVDNFVQPFQVDKTDKSGLVEKITAAQGKLKQSLQQLCQFNDDDFKLSIVAKPNQQNLNQLYAYVMFEDQDKAIKYFEEIKKAKTNYFTHNVQIAIRITEQSQSLANLFSIGIIKPDPKQSDQSLQDQLLKVLKQLYQGILQVSIRPSKKKVTDVSADTSAVETYLAFVTLDNEDNGRQLLATYKDKNKSILRQFYKTEPFFNIFVSSNLKKELNKAKQGYKKMSKQVKNYGDNLKKEQYQFNAQRKRIPFAYPNMGNPINPMGNPMGHPIGNPLANPMGAPLIRGAPIGMGFPVMNPLAGGIGFPGGNPLLSQAPALERADLLKDKQKYLKTDPQVVKRLIFHTLKTEIQQTGVHTNAATMQANKILFQSDINTLFVYLENKEQLKKKLQSMSPSN